MQATSVLVNEEPAVGSACARNKNEKFGLKEHTSSNKSKHDDHHQIQQQQQQQKDNRMSQPLRKLTLWTKVNTAMLHTFCAIVYTITKPFGLHRAAGAMLLVLCLVL